MPLCCNVCFYCLFSCQVPRITKDDVDLWSILLQYPVDEIVALAAAIENQSEHPLASSVLNFAEERLGGPEREDKALSPHKSTPRSQSSREFERLKSTSFKSAVSETELVPLASGRSFDRSPGKTRHRHAGVWLRSAKDVQPVQGRAHNAIADAFTQAPHTGAPTKLLSLMAWIKKY